MDQTDTDREPGDTVAADSGQQVGRAAGQPNKIPFKGWWAIVRRTVASFFRDRVMLEVLYATGLRVSELVGLQLGQIGINQGLVRIIGKGDKERLVPLGEEALDWLQRFLSRGREMLLDGQQCSAVFPTRRGAAMTRQAFWYRIKKHALTAGIIKPLSPHTLRHAFATHLLDHGADLRVVQILFFFNDTATTEIYTHVARERLSNLHAKHHPRG